jgi:hypothetical protein
MTDFKGRNWRNRGSDRGFSQLIRLRIYGVTRMAMVAALTPSRTSRMSSSRVWVWEPLLATGTWSGSTALKNLISLAVPWTVFAI